MQSLIHYIASKTSISNKSIESTIHLINQDCTIPFISRYRKEATGNLDEVQVGDIVTLKKDFEALQKRKESILKSLEEQAVLSDELKQKIENTDTLIALEDLYLPYKKSRKTKADTARENGLEPLAKIIMAQNANDLDFLASKYLNKNISSEENALEGARHIIAEWINERIDIRNSLRNQYDRYSEITTKVVKAKAEEENAQKYRDYFDWNEPLKRCPSHRLLAILRAENEGFIKLKISIDQDRALDYIENRIIKSDNHCATQIELAIKDAFKRLLAPALANEALSNAKEKADTTAIAVFAKNLNQLLLSPPLGEKTILAIDPGFRTGCKIVCLDKQGGLVHNETIYPHEPRKEATQAIKKISTLVNAYKIEAIAIGNGTASRETETLIKRIRFETDVQVFVVSEAGASIYSASKIAREEFPNYDVTVRGAVSIGRRLSDPLAELVKIEAKSIGVGQYQHDVDQTKLKEALDRVVESCVNKVGVNINTASPSLLSYVSGIGEKLAENIVIYRDENGAFTSREEIKNVTRLGNKAFEQSAGFLRIKNAKNPLDDSAVHPESYSVVKKMAADLKVNIQELVGNKELIKTIQLKKYCTENIGLPTLTDIVKELEKPGIDPREKAKIFEFDPTIKTINDLREGQILPGIVNNITNFGCFVDIGIKESGLVHISKLTDGYITDVNEVVSLQQHVKVKVIEIDIPRKRIQLAMNF
ncbi:transcriptional accessory protein [Galbibacter orientalis DSM 19592]|uniref:Transcriptional accessory protein n=1 Tax=Galbibacter orientalis DSM 19592 TaxID=926559 RepID=I3C2X0_9FLAO|nr:Tex family protein [Galbibacter orientalis]EIJ37963.1 transcriptional accessory protein [Galbibacter orientalis DSM 19592]